MTGLAMASLSDISGGESRMRLKMSRRSLIGLASTSSLSLVGLVAARMRSRLPRSILGTRNASGKTQNTVQRLLAVSSARKNVIRKARQ
jgi:hypothetical protein